MRKTPEPIAAFITDHYLEYTNDELIEQIRKRFGAEYTYAGIKSFKDRRHLIGGPRKEVPSKVYPPEVQEYIKAHYKGTGRQQMCDQLKEKFGIEYRPSQIKGFYARFHLDSGINGYFLKGQESHNKGKKLTPEEYKRLSKTMFKKGNAPHNALPVGSEIKRDGYWWVKTAEPATWEQKHRLLWQQVNGPIPEGMIIAFKDGDSENITIENLFMLTKSEHTAMNRWGYRSQDPDITEAGLAVIKLKQAIIDKKKERRAKK